MARVLTLSLLLSLAPVAASADSVPSDPERGCSSRWPATIRVHRIHRRGSSIPARVDVVPFRVYVERVMASGAWPAYKPMASLRAGAAVIAARAHWFVCHPQPGYVRDGRLYDIHDGSPRKALRGRSDAGQLYRGPWRIHSRIRRAVADVEGVLLRRGDAMAKPRWSGDGGRCGSGVTGNALPEDAVTACARQGMSWRAILRLYLPRVQVVR